MKAAIYARVSTTNGQSPAMQLDELRDYCRRRGWEILEEYVDNGHSGARESRPALDRLMADARKRLVDAVVVYRYDRFARSLRQLVNALEEFRALGEHRIRSIGGKASHLSLWFEGKDLLFSLLCPRSNRLPRRRWARRRLSGARVGPFCVASQIHAPSSGRGRLPARRPKTPPRGRPEGVGNKARATGETGCPKTNDFGQGEDRWNSEKLS